MMIIDLFKVSAPITAADGGGLINLAQATEYVHAG